MITSGTFGGTNAETNTGAGSGTDGSTKRPRGNRAGWKIQQKRRREEWEAQGGKGGWNSKRHSGGYTSDDWKAWKRETAARAWNQRMMDRGADSDKGKGKEKGGRQREGFHQGVRKINTRNGVILD